MKGLKRFWIAIPLAVGILIGGAANVTARQDHPAPFRGTVHQVRLGETLWEIAKDAHPGSDPRRMVSRIKSENGLRSSVVRPGQKLRIPAP
ncbi:MAG TPA: LysM peptidoglycan-binding domain-containing protein [Actinomycetota bacterium]|nr:LysM peptidoglycan-binding domain-containing protein [Actinomycetota bacterium]